MRMKKLLDDDKIDTSRGFRSRLTRARNKETNYGCNALLMKFTNIAVNGYISTEISINIYELPQPVRDNLSELDMTMGDPFFAPAPIDKLKIPSFQF